MSIALSAGMAGGIRCAVVVVVYVWFISTEHTYQESIRLQGVINKMCQLPEFIIVRDHVADPCSS